MRYTASTKGVQDEPSSESVALSAVILY